MHRIGFIVNPIAGMGGIVGLKGTDGKYGEALRLGAKPVSPIRARRFLTEFTRIFHRPVMFYTAPSIMGEKYLNEAGLKYVVIGEISIPTSREDTIRIAENLARHVDIIVFVGGDGTARDILDSIDEKIPVIGVPSGVKMFSSVFTPTPEKAAELLKLFLDGETKLHLGEVIDVDEEHYRRDIIQTKLYGYLKIPFLPGYVQGSKTPLPLDDLQEEVRSIAKYIVDNMERNTLYITSPGNTVKEVHRILNLEYTLLGVDAIYNNELVGKDLNIFGLRRLISLYKKAKILVSPIGGQGLLFGRGNQVIAPEIIRMVGIDNIMILSPIWKINTFRCIYVDTGDRELDEEFPPYFKVLVRYGEFRVVKKCI